MGTKHNFLCQGLSDKQMRDLVSLYGSQSPTILLREISPVATKSGLASALSSMETMIVVRHPFARLGSAYRNKFARYDAKFFTEYGVHMVARYRERAEALFPPDQFRTAMDEIGQRGWDY